MRYALVNEAGPPIGLDGGGTFPSAATVFVELDDDLDAWLELGVVKGKPAVLRVTVEPAAGGVTYGPQFSSVRRRRPGAPLTARAVRAVMVRGLFDEAIAYCARVLALRQARNLLDTEDATMRSLRRRIIDDEFLRQVASVVRADESGAPNKAVRRAFYTSQRNASRWIAQARSRGFLPADGPPEEEP